MHGKGVDEVFLIKTGTGMRSHKRKVTLHLHTKRTKNRFSVVLNGEFPGTRFRQGIVSSADFCYNGDNEKPPSEREGDHASGGRSLRDFGHVLTFLLRTLPKPPSEREGGTTQVVEGACVILDLC